MGKQHPSRITCLRYNLLIIAFESYKSGIKLSMSKIPGYYLQRWLCWVYSWPGRQVGVRQVRLPVVTGNYCCSSSKIGIFSIFGGVKCASGDSVRQVM